MNEIQLLREQLATERMHVRAVAIACAAAHDASSSTGGAGAAGLEELSAACTQYLACVLEWFEQRDARLAALQLPPEASTQTALAALSAGSWAKLASLINGTWDARRAAVEAALATRATVTDWRAFAGITADSVYQERALYARVRQSLPAGIALS